jgi:RND superfamily putative drug exporter
MITATRFTQRTVMLRLARWCMTHRRQVVVGWIAVAVLITALAGSVGRHYATNFALPGTQSQRAADLLTHDFKAQSGDLDTIVFHVSRGTIDSPRVRATVEALLARVRTQPHVIAATSPYSGRGSLQISSNRMTAFATISYDRRANLLPAAVGKPVLHMVNAIHVRGMSIAAGGQVIEAAEGFSIGPATTVSVIAALVILLITFGSLTAAGMPLVTAGLGLITGVGLIGLATRVTSMSNVAPQLAVMIGLGVGVDYALFIFTRFREAYVELRDVERAAAEAMDTAGRAVLLAGATVVIALLGMFATGISFMYGLLAIASVIAVLLTMAASLTLLPALLSWLGPRLGRPRRTGARTLRGARWRRWSEIVQARPRSLTVLSLGVMIALLVPAFALRLETSDAGNDPANVSSRHAFDLIARGFGPGFNGPLMLVAKLRAGNSAPALAAVRAAAGRAPGVVAVTQPRVASTGRLAVMEVYPASAPQASATSDLVNRLRHQVLPGVERRNGISILVGGLTAGSIDFSHVLFGKLPLFIGIVVLLSALLLFVIFRSLVIPVQAAVMNLLSIGGAIGATVAVFHWGWLDGLLGVQKGPVEPWIPVLMFAVVFGLSMDYEVFLVSRVREQWVRSRDPSRAVADGIASTGRVITAAAAIMVCVFLSFMLGDQRTIKEFGFGLAFAVFLDALVVRCVLLPRCSNSLVSGPGSSRSGSMLACRTSTSRDPPHTPGG